MNYDLQRVLNQIPGSDEDIAKAIGNDMINAKDIKDIRAGKPFDELTSSWILEYIDELTIKCLKYLCNGNNIPMFYEISDLPIAPRYLNYNKKDKLLSS